MYTTSLPKNAKYAMTRSRRLHEETKTTKTKPYFGVFVFKIWLLHLQIKIYAFFHITYNNVNCLIVKSAFIISVILEI